MKRPILKKWQTQFFDVVIKGTEPKMTQPPWRKFQAEEVKLYGKETSPSPSTK